MKADLQLINGFENKTFSRFATRLVRDILAVSRLHYQRLFRPRRFQLPCNQKTSFTKSKTPDTAWYPIPLVLIVFFRVRTKQQRLAVPSPYQFTAAERRRSPVASAAKRRRSPVASAAERR